MDKVLIISNVSSKELGNFITQRGAFTVAGCYSSLSENIIDIQNNILDVAKTVYLYQPEEGPTNIRSDMQLLQSMIQSNSFFKPGEIIFMTRASQQCERAKEYFITVMKSCKKDDYMIKTMQEAISFSDVYNCLLGISDTSNFKNSYRTFYRAERNSDTTVYYESQDDTDLIIEPFSFDNLKNYQKQKDMLQGMTSPIQYKDDEVELKQYDNPHFNSVKYENVTGKSNVTLITGKPKSGLSTWATALAISAHKATKSTLVIDFSVNRDILFQLGEAIEDYNEYTEKDILQHRNQSNGLNICSYSNLREFNTRFNFLSAIFTNYRLQYDVIIIAVDYRDFERADTILKNNIDNLLFSVVPRYSDVLELLDFAEYIEEKPPIVIMNECIKSTEEFMSQEQIKETLEDIDAKVVGSIWFDNLNVGANLYNAILGGN